VFHKLREESKKSKEKRLFNQAMGIMAEGLPPTAVLQGGEGAPFFMAIKYCGG